MLRVATGPRVRLAGCKSALNHSPPTPPTTPWFILLTVLRLWSRFNLTLCCFVVYSTRRFVLNLVLCYFVLVVFSPLSIAITSLGEERANLSGFRTFVRFALVWFCLFLLPLGGKGCGLWLWHSLDFFATRLLLYVWPVCNMHILVCWLCHYNLLNWICKEVFVHSAPDCKQVYQVFTFIIYFL